MRAQRVRQNIAAIAVGYWGGSGAFNSVTEVLERHFLGWLAVGVVLTAFVAVVGARRSRKPGELGEAADVQDRWVFTVNTHR